MESRGRGYRGDPQDAEIPHRRGTREKPVQAMKEEGRNEEKGAGLPQKAGPTTMQQPKHILVTRKEIARSGGVRGAMEEALSLAALEMTPQAMTAYEAAGSGPTEADGAGIVVQVEVTNEQELREALGAGAEAVVVSGANTEQARQLREIARALRAGVIVQAEPR